MITIDKLTLQLSGLSEEEGRKLARLLAQELAMVTLPAGTSADVSKLNVNTTMNASQPTGSQMDTLSQRIVAGMLSELQRTL